jgi:hypothetical protein
VFDVPIWPFDQLIWSDANENSPLRSGLWVCVVGGQFDSADYATTAANNAS